MIPISLILIRREMKGRDELIWRGKGEDYILCCVGNFLLSSFLTLDDCSCITLAMIDER